MATQALYLKWRPQSFGDVIGQAHITRTLIGAIRLDRVRHAYLFSGPRGTGKTTTARLLAKAVNCLNEDPATRPCNACTSCRAINSGRFLDIIEIDAASHTGVDDVRDLRDKIAFAPSEGRYKVYIIDEVHRFSGAAFDALLKTLEEPPNHAIFVLATTEIHKVPDTIKSRCLIFEFRRVSLQEVVDRLRMICDSEGLRVDDEVLTLVARQGTGSVRDSISLLDQIVTDPNEHVSYEIAQMMLGAAGNRYVWEVTQALVEQDTAYGLDQINAAIDTGADPRQFGRQLVDHLRRLLLMRMGSEHLVDASEEERRLLAEQAQYFEHRALLKAIRAFNSAIDDMRGGWQPQLPLELALVESAAAIDDVPPPAPPPPQRRPPTSSTGNLNPKKVEALSTAQIEAEGVDFDSFRQAWPQIVQEATANKRTLRGLMQSCEPLRVDSGSTLIIGLQDANFRQQLEDRITFIEEAVFQIFGEGIAIRLELMAENTTANVGVATNSLIQRDEFFTRAQREFGAEINFLDEE